MDPGVRRDEVVFRYGGTTLGEVDFHHGVTPPG
jgi:hypothetical protein